MRLSKRGWNNVLIFGILLVVFIVNFQQELALTHSTHSETVIPKNLTVLEVETPDYLVTRIGRAWQSDPQIGLSSKQIEQIIFQWQHHPLVVSNDLGNSMATLSYRFYVAEQKQPIVVTIHQQEDDNYIVEVDNKRFLQLPATELTRFMGR